MIRLIKFHIDLKVKQEICFRTCVEYLIKGKNYPIPYLNEFRSINLAVKKVESKLPWIYFTICNIFFTEHIKNKADEILKDK